ncbi:hypothetical protein DL769_003385 [Monosporascus sp. CRB-8-3]|nr:hypothetical protein DL769_003385 [Monosporascus sp. CRB-8-3]
MTEDLSEFVFDMIVSAATGPGRSMGHIGRQLASLELAAASGSFVNPADNVEQPVVFPTSQASDELKALRVDEQFATRTTRAYTKSQMSESVKRVPKGGNPQSALDYIVQREIKAAKEAGRPPMFDHPRIRDELYTYLLAGHDTIAGHFHTGHPIPKNTYLFLNLTGPSFTAPFITVEEGRRSETSKLGRGARTNWDNSQPAAFNPER